MNPDWFVDGLDGVEFARTQLGFEPDAKQCLLLRSRVQRGLLNCSRQWGKSTVAAIKAVHLAKTRPKSLVLVVSPTGKQVHEFVRKASEFVQQLEIWPRGDGDNECSLLPTGRGSSGCRGRRRRFAGFRPFLCC